MQLVNDGDHLVEVDNRCAALTTILTPLVDNGTFSEKLRDAALQQYATELQTVQKRMTPGF